MGLFGPSEEEKVAYQEAKEVFKELTKQLHLPKSAYMPKVEVKQLQEKVGTYDPDKHVLRINKTIVKQYLEAKKSLYELEKEKSAHVNMLKEMYGERISQLEKEIAELERKANVSEGMNREFYQKMLENKKQYLNRVKTRMEYAIENTEKRYERLKEEKEKRIENLRRYVRGGTIHEFVHAIRYRMHPETKKYERVDPVRREVEDALANMAEAIILDMNEKEIIRTIRGYESSLVGSLYESIGSLLASQAELYEKIFKLSEKEKEEIKKQKMTGKATKGFLRGYKLGLIAALGIKDKPREERISILEELLKNDNPEEILKRLREMADYSLKKHPELREAIMTEEEMYKQIRKEVEEEARKKKSANFVLVSLIAFIIFLSFLLPNLTKSERITGSSLVWSKGTYLSFFLLFFSMMIILSIFLVKNTSSKEIKA